MDKVTIIDGKIFKCRQCGECCRHLDIISQMKEFDSGNGTCKFLDNNKCAIYNKRPDICQGEYVYHKFYEGMDVDEYYNMLYRLCDLIRGGSLN